MPVTSEVELYDPVKAFLEAQGYDVKGEVRSCDLVAVRPGEPPVLVELKLRFSLSLVLQGIDRLALSDRYIWRCRDLRGDASPGRMRTTRPCASCAGCWVLGC